MTKQEKLAVAFATVLKNLKDLSDAELNLLYFQSWTELMEREKEDQ